jgi:hypothetical protein
VPEVEAGIDAFAILGKAAQWLTSALASKFLGDKIDQARGRDVEAQVRRAAARLQKQLDQGKTDHQELRQLSASLALAKTELEALKNILASAPNIKQLERDSRQLEADLLTTKAALMDCEKRLETEERVTERHDHDIETIKDRIDKLESRMRAPAEGAAARVIIKVGGRDNRIRLANAMHSVPTGVFLISQNNAQAFFSVPPGSQAVVELLAPGNLISMPATLAANVKIISHGWYYRSEVH